MKSLFTNIQKQHNKKKTLKKLQTSRVNNPRILTIKKADVASVYYFYINTNIDGDFQICISVPLRQEQVNFLVYGQDSKESRARQLAK